MKARVDGVALAVLDVAAPDAPEAGGAGPSKGKGRKRKRGAAAVIVQVVDPSRVSFILSPWRDSASTGGGASAAAKDDEGGDPLDLSLAVRQDAMAGEFRTSATLDAGDATELCDMLVGMLPPSLASELARQRRVPRKKRRRAVAAEPHSIADISALLTERVVRVRSSSARLPYACSSKLTPPLHLTACLCARAGYARNPAIASALRQRGHQPARNLG
jgi:hypothetical protein